MIGKNIQDNLEVKPNTREMEKLRNNFPQFFTKDGEFKLDAFKDFLGEEEIKISKEGYELNFLGKSYAKYQSSLETETYLSPDLEHNNKEENKNSENIYIVGDNIDALKHLLGSYAGKIKCIYIDPPYNTGSDGFVYPDKFQFKAEELADSVGVTEEEAQRILDLAGKNTHSAWLTFMYPRLLLARELLSEDGVIFISIDDNEQGNLRLICDEIFGEENFIANLFWNKTATPPSLSKDIRKKYEVILSYQKSIKREVGLSAGVVEGGDMPLLNESNVESELYFDNESVNFKIDGYYKKGIYSRVELLEDIIIKNGKANSDLKLRGKFKWKQDTVNKEIKKGTIFWVKSDKFAIRYERKGLRRKKPSNIINKMECGVGTNDDASDYIERLFKGKNIFDFPKPVSLIKYLINMITSENDYILDFFSGSATTADSTMRLNSESEGKRKYIMVQLPEEIEKDKPAYKSGYRTIDEIGRDRIKKAGEKIKEDTGADIDYGYKLYYLEKPEEKTLTDLENFVPEIKFVSDDMVSVFDNSHAPGKENILATWLADDGYGLTKRTEEYQLDKYKANLIDKSLYIIDQGLESEDVMSLIKKIEEGELDINRVVVYTHSVIFSTLQELRKNLKVLKNNKNVNLIERF